MSLMVHADKRTLILCPWRDWPKSTRQTTRAYVERDYFLSEWAELRVEPQHRPDTGLNARWQVMRLGKVARRGESKTIDNGCRAAETALSGIWEEELERRRAAG